MSTSPDGAHRGPVSNRFDPNQAVPNRSAPHQSAPGQAGQDMFTPNRAAGPVHDRDRADQRTEVLPTGPDRSGHRNGVGHLADANHRDEGNHRDVGNHRDEGNRRDGSDHRDGPDRGDALDRQRSRFGGIKWGSAFFGWLTAVGTAVLLTALITGVGGAVGLSAVGGPGQATDQAGQAAQVPGAAEAGGITAAIVAAVVLLVAYFCGGYVAGRMARFDGIKQGVAVWVWTVVITLLAAALVTIAGAQFDVLGALGGIQLPLDGQALTTAGIVAAVVALVVSLVGAVLGGLAGMRFHRRVDRAGLDDGASRIGTDRGTVR